MEEIKTPCDHMASARERLKKKIGEFCRGIGECLKRYYGKLKQDLTELSKTDKPKPVEASFRYQNIRAKEVKLASDFNNWKGKLMERGKEGEWHLKVKLPPGKHAYKFIVDGNWIKDPKNQKTQPDGFGGESSVLEL